MPSPFCFKAFYFVSYLRHRCLVVIGTWSIAKSLLLFLLRFYPQITTPNIFVCWQSHNFTPVLGRVVIGSLVVYQASGAGSIPFASTTVLTVLARSIGNGQKSYGRFAWEGLERSGPFPIFRHIGWNAVLGCCINAT